MLYLLGSVVVFGACLALFIVTLALSFSLTPPTASAASQVAAAYESRGHVLLEGLRYVLHRRVVLGVISLDLFAVLFGGATALLPIFAGDVLHIGPAGLGLLCCAPRPGSARR